MSCREMEDDLWFVTGNQIVDDVGERHVHVQCFVGCASGCSIGTHDANRPRLGLPEMRAQKRSVLSAGAGNQDVISQGDILAGGVKGKVGAAG